MAICPFAVWRPLKENETQPFLTPTQLIWHSAADPPGTTNLHSYFNQDKIKVESHFWIPLNGVLEQFIDTNRTADANKDANRTAISVETEDDGTPDTRKWTPEQLSTMRRLAMWAHLTHKIPLTPCTNPKQPGQGFHSMWSYQDNYNLTGQYSTSPWTPVPSKTCPGKIRVKQWWDEFIPQINNQSVKEIKVDAQQAKLLVSSLYEIALDRQPDTQGAAYWENIAISQGEVTCLVQFLIAANTEIRQVAAKPKTAPTTGLTIQSVLDELVARIQQ